MSPGIAPRGSPSPRGDTDPPIFRAPMRSRTIETHAGAGADFAVRVIARSLAHANDKRAS
jgi:hypothetical protein